MSDVAVLKFGGTSVATHERREVAVRRVADAREAGFAPVAVVSAMGRPPDPYATDTLLALVGNRLGTPQGDVVLAAGELISAGVFAEELNAAGIPATALSGAQAGILTDDRFGDARILEVDPRPLLDAIDRGRVPVVAGYQGATASGETTTLGRGGTDLSAIALGHALEAKRVDIYTDVSGAMTADPRRLPSARTIERASLHEMSELVRLPFSPSEFFFCDLARFPVFVGKTPSVFVGKHHIRFTRHFHVSDLSRYLFLFRVSSSSSYIWVLTVKP
jgi:aspartate kinase